jgi:hypothetical protein
VARFYKGVGVGTHHHGADLRLTGLSPRNPGSPYNPTSVMHHIARGTTTSPLISLTKSYGVAEDYARNASRTPPTAANPARVYEVEISDPPPRRARCNIGGRCSRFHITDPAERSALTCRKIRRAAFGIKPLLAAAQRRCVQPESCQCDGHRDR